jgi:cellobiose-specific phosphotransferase system component IIB
MPLWMESRWVDTGEKHQDEAARLFNVGRVDVNLLAPKQRMLFHHILTELTKQGKKVTPKTFVEFIDYSESGE